MDQNTTVTNENTSFSTFLIIAGAILALGAAAGIGWWIWSQHKEIKDLEAEIDKLKKDIAEPKFSDMEKGVLWQIYSNGIATGKSVGDLGREVETQLAALRKDDNKAQKEALAPAQQPAQGQTPAQPQQNQAPAPAPQQQNQQSAPAPQQTPAAPANNQPANQGAQSSSNQSWTAQS
jgi:hypothetical protein